MCFDTGVFRVCFFRNLVRLSLPLFLYDGQLMTLLNFRFMNGNFDRLDIVMDRSDPFEGGGDQGPGGPNRDANDSAVRSFIGQGPSTPQALPLSVRTNSDLIHCSSQTATISGRTATQFQSERHSAKLLQTLNKFRTQKNGYLCDVTLKIGSKTFHVHKTILAGSSPYFEAMFTSCMEESSKQEIEIKGTDF